MTSDSTLTRLVDCDAIYSTRTSRPPMRCRCCYLPSIAQCQEDVNWFVCRTHTISAGACGFYPQLIVGGEVVTPERAIEMHKERQS